MCAEYSIRSELTIYFECIRCIWSRFKCIITKHYAVFIARLFIAFVEMAVECASIAFDMTKDLGGAVYFPCGLAQVPKRRASLDVHWNICVGIVSSDESVSADLYRIGLFAALNVRWNMQLSSCVLMSPIILTLSTSSTHPSFSCIEVSVEGMWPCGRRCCIKHCSVLTSSAGTRLLAWVWWTTFIYCHATLIRFINVNRINSVPNPLIVEQSLAQLTRLLGQIVIFVPITIRALLQALVFTSLNPEAQCLWISKDARAVRIEWPTMLTPACNLSNSSPSLGVNAAATWLDCKEYGNPYPFKLA